MPAFYRLLGWGYAGVCATLAALAWAQQQTIPPVPVPAIQPPPASLVPAPSPATNAANWFRQIKPYCNTVEMTTVESNMPAPPTIEGAGYHAACFALAGRIDDARRAIDALAELDRERAALIVFDVGHPVADAGDDRSAGPMMELVVDYVPNHYMALYHAGMAEYMLGQRDLAKRNLTAFLNNYSPADGWRSNAIDVLGRLDDVNAAADPRRPREP